jgi:small subunit ribosomal protein S6e
MPTFQVVVGGPESGDSYAFDVDGQAANRFIGRELGAEVDGSAVGLDGYTLELTGGSDDAGRPMREDVAGSNLTEIMLAERSTGYHPDRDGERRRVTVRGREITEDVVQINATVSETGPDPIPVTLGEEDAEEAAAESDEE